MNEIKTRIKLDSRIIQSNNLTFPFYADAIILITQNWETKTSKGSKPIRYEYNKKDKILNVFINNDLIDSSSYLEIMYYNQQLMRDLKIEEILK